MYNNIEKLELYNAQSIQVSVTGLKGLEIILQSGNCYELPG